jgi:hypothetical protein
MLPETVRKATGDPLPRDLFLAAYRERLDLGFADPDPLIHSTRKPRRVGANGTGVRCARCGAITFGLSDRCGRCGR